MAKPTIRLSDTALRQWESCHKKFWFRRVENLVPKERIRVFDIGTLGHIGCATFFHPSNQIFDEQTKYKMARSAMEKAFAEMPNADKDVLQEAQKTFSVVFRRKLEARVISVEHWWETLLEYDDINVQFVGKVDAISLDPTGVLYVEENKFVDGRGFSDRRIRLYQSAPQVIGYIALANANLRKTVRGVVHNFYVKMQNPKLEQRITYVGPKDLSRWNAYVHNAAVEIAQAYTENNWRENMLECVTFTGECPYYRLCTFDDNAEIRKELYDTHASEDKFFTLDSTERATSAEGFPQKAV